ncbi:MAG TPA: NAD(P)/FAD-dependent oxidoreductase [Pseudonocardiaceae bacterium]|nr:NAD(P)/FAD-dependent oxidoreductase [Pseudonocardiaceae bacterium]
MAETVDVVVIGMGPGGESVATQLAEAGLDVVGVDARLLGGECPYYGCIPSKMIIRGANVLAEGRRVQVLAGDSTVRPDFAPVAERIRKEATDNWDDKVAVDRFTAKGGRFLRGRGRLTGPHTVTVTSNGSGEQVELTARRGIVLNTGTDPAVPPIDGIADTPYWTNRDILTIEKAPESLAVLGSGAIGCELAQAFARFGTRVSVLGRSARLLAYEEPESSELVEAAFAEDGIAVHNSADVSKVHYDGTFTLEFGTESVQTQHLLVASGRRSTIDQLGVDAIGLDPKSKVLPPDDQLRIADGVWAIGDITGKGAFTHMSMYQAAIATRSILGTPGHGAEYHAVPRVTFTDPEVGSVGMSEAQAKDQGLNVRVGVAQIPSSTRGWIHKAGNTGLIKLVEDADKGVLVGATSAGPTGGEVLSALVVAVHAEVPTERLRQMIYAYPTFHRTIEQALAGLENQRTRQG